ncbi:hypothetical protein M422DRAFT_31582 [Sphaerobolus stellatus SS14]|uniref:Unplaced genomic scaffold SPHSTscaffold_119, whole genome shotgun sequence n=1 Tax=Sphaerobolus stellatus (strain SS14) TaxID=990650 RepID=A0A0C9VBM1_SPHS4|nr:hypothetical protein M422DRAFT_34838 [Sphaerobolus stellatus SS14]KIJ41977.1 hypothetical protein M422DRAFT_31582 [Sphaerobolus stellatus SS14]
MVDKITPIPEHRQNLFVCTALTLFRLSLSVDIKSIIGRNSTIPYLQSSDGASLYYKGAKTLSLVFLMPQVLQEANERSS